MKNFKILFFVIVVFTFIGGRAEVSINFENPGDYKAIGVYDAWPSSPFMTDVLNGNFGIVKNPDTSQKNIDGLPLNASSRVLGCQRSRYGSNRFGVRVDLKEIIELSPDTLYIHLLLFSPKQSRVMLIGLGSRRERLDQNPYTEQFYVMSENALVENQWSYMLFPIRGAKGVDIRSLVIIPDCESPHELKEDFLFYVDNIGVTKTGDLWRKLDTRAELGSSMPNDKDRVIVNDNQLNGEVVAADGRKLNSLELPAGQPFKIKVIPENGFFNGGIEVIFGTHGEKEFIPKGNFDSENCFVIPGYMMQGEVLIKGKMIEQK